MIVLEFKLKGKPQQYRVVDDTIRTAQFIRNKALRYWMDNQDVKLSDLYKQCAVLAKEFERAGKLNSMARQASAERAILLSNVSLLIVKPINLERKGIRSSRKEPVRLSTRLQAGIFLLTKERLLSPKTKGIT